MSCKGGVESSEKHLFLECPSLNSEQESFIEDIKVMWEEHGYNNNYEAGDDTYKLACLLAVITPKKSGIFLKVAEKYVEEIWYERMRVMEEGETVRGTIGTEE